MLGHLIKKISNRITRHYFQFKVFGKRKYFCIGQNKTGTTSLEKAFLELGFVLGNQRNAELLLKDYKNHDYKRIIDHCKSAQVFQDFPFSFPETYKVVDKAFPGSKFILTIRSSSDEWYSSVVNFHAKRFGRGNIPTMDDLKSADYVWKGWIWECNRILYQTPENDIYNKNILISHYEAYNQEVLSYFKDRPGDLLVIDLSEKGSYQKFCKFINVTSGRADFPWENKTADIKK